MTFIAMTETRKILEERIKSFVTPAGILKGAAGFNLLTAGCPVSMPKRKPCLHLALRTARSCRRAPPASGKHSFMPRPRKGCCRGLGIADIRKSIIEDIELY